MRELWIVRHGRAVDREETNLSDFDRPLTARGRREFSAMCGLLSKRMERPDVVLSSPKVRAMQTAEVLCREFSIRSSRLSIENFLGGDYDRDLLLWSLRSKGIGVGDRVAIIGHEPVLSSVLSEFIGGGAVRLSKGSIACLRERDPQGGYELRWLSIPKIAS